MLTLPKHEFYTDSGIPDLGEVPAHWKVIRNRFLFREQNARSLDGKETHLCMSQKLGLVPSNDFEDKTLQSESYEGARLCKQGDLVLNRLKAHLSVFATAPCDGLVSPDYSVFRLRDSEMVPKYFEHLFKTPVYLSEFNRRVRGIVVGFYRLYSGDFSDVRALCPPVEEQKRIVEFLDRTTTEIDRAIAQKQRLIELLQEQKAILINRAVTKGLNPNVPMQDSGIEWIGEIPQSWKLKKLKYISKIKYGLGQPPREKIDGLPLIRATNIERGKIVNTNLIRVDPQDVPYEREPVLKDGDIIVVRSGFYTADSAIVTKEYDGSIAGYDMVVSARGEILPKYLSFCLLSKYVLYDQLYLLRMRAAQPHLNAEELGETLILVPPMDEQLLMIYNLHELVKEEDFVEKKVLHEIELLNEFKTLMITNTVIGKIKV